MFDNACELRIISEPPTETGSARGSNQNILLKGKNIMATEIISKRCSKCKQNKPLSEFSRHRGNKDGLQNYCKSCEKAHQKKYQQTPNGRAVHRQAQEKFRNRHSNYVKAVHAVNNAIRDGRLPRPDTLPCHYCPAQAQEYHHHKGYEPEHWLDIVPTCLECHKKEHRKIA